MCTSVYAVYIYIYIYIYILIILLYSHAMTRVVGGFFFFIVHILIPQPEFNAVTLHVIYIFQ